MYTPYGYIVNTYRDIIGPYGFLQSIEHYVLFSKDGRHWRPIKDLKASARILAIVDGKFLLQIWYDKGWRSRLIPSEIVVFDPVTEKVVERYSIPKGINIYMVIPLYYDVNHDGKKELLIELIGDLRWKGKEKRHYNIGPVGYIIYDSKGNAPKPLDTNNDLILDAVEYPNGTVINLSPYKEKWPPCVKNTGIVYFSNLASMEYEFDTNIYKWHAYESRKVREQKLYYSWEPWLITPYVVFFIVIFSIVVFAKFPNNLIP